MFFLVVLTLVVKHVCASLGDKSYVYRKCLKDCFRTECADENAFNGRQIFIHKLLRWTCYGECQYDCMWTTVDAFVKDASPVPQFHGKWPFVRIFGMQEPASVLFSILNGLGHLMIFNYRKKVSSSTPMYYVWHALALVSLNAWTWSAVYHSRDTDFTEMMDYFFALSIVMFNVFALVCRVLGTAVLWKPAVVGSLLLALYFKHIHFLAFVRFDYGYNMKFNIAFAVLSSVGWLLWCGYHRKQKHVRLCAAVMAGFSCASLLELFDFPPLLWAFDGHALWHAATAPINYVWWKFIIADGIHLQEREEEKKKVV